MRKVFFMSFVLWGYGVYSQGYTVEQVEKTQDTKIVANFIKYNPNHPKTPEFRRKLYVMLSGGNSGMVKSNVAFIDKKTMTADVKREVKKGEVSEGNKKTAELLTHLFNNDPTKSEAYIHIRNLSKCNLNINITGKSFYTLTVPAQNDNYILLPKGTYTIATSVCDAKYSSVKNIQKDTEITLNLNPHLPRS